MPIGVGMLTAGKVAQEVGGITPFQWAARSLKARGLVGMTSGAATYTALETSIIAVGTSLLNWTLASVAYETGVLGGSMINSVPIAQCGWTMRNATTDLFEALLPP